MSQLRMNAADDDIEIANNTLSLVDGDTEIRQRLIQNLRTFLGEWFLDETLGVPYFQLIFIKGTPVDVMEALFKSAILNTLGVTELTRFEPLDLDPAKRKLLVDFKASTIEGTIEIEGVIP